MTALILVEDQVFEIEACCEACAIGFALIHYAQWAETEDGKVIWPPKNNS